MRRPPPSRRARDAVAGATPPALLERSFVFEGAFGDNPKLLDALEIAEKAAPDRPAGADRRRKRHRQGTDGQGDPRQRRARRPALHLGQLRRHSREPARVRTVRPPARARSPAPPTTARASSRARIRGTIFLDEIGELPLPGQVKLLRVLQSHEIQRVGSDETDRGGYPHRRRHQQEPAQAHVSEGTFREDLFYRLSVIHVTLPPLRERRDEIPLLFELLRRRSRRSAEARARSR